MKFIEFFSNIAMPLIIIIIVLYGVIERKKVFDIFLDGAKEGIGVVFNIFPTLVGLFVAIGALRSSGIIDLIVRILTPFFNILYALYAFHRTHEERQPLKPAVVSDYINKGFIKNHGFRDVNHGTPVLCFGYGNGGGSGSIGIHLNECLLKGRAYENIAPR